MDSTMVAVTPDRQFKCAGCGNYANEVGSTFCQCATSILVRRSDDAQLVKPFLLHREIEAIAEQRTETIEKIRDGLGLAPDARHRIQSEGRTGAGERETALVDAVRGALECLGRPEGYLPDIGVPKTRALQRAFEAYEPHPAYKKGY